MLATDATAKALLDKWKIPMPNQGLSDEEISSTSRTSSGPIRSCSRKARRSRRLDSSGGRQPGQKAMKGSCRVAEKRPARGDRQLPRH
jgi:hypothetical protein